MYLKNQLSLIVLKFKNLNSREAEKFIDPFLFQYDCIEIKIFYSTRILIYKVKTEMIEWKKIFVMPRTDKVFIIKIHQEFLQIS